MNSVNESLCYSVPFILFPQTAEQSGVANRVAQMKAEVFLKKNDVRAIKEAVDAIIGVIKENT